MNSIGNRTTNIWFLALATILSFGDGASASDFGHRHRDLALAPGHVGPYLPRHVDRSPDSKSGTWTDVNGPIPPVNPEISILLTDGRVMVHSACTRHWYLLTPDGKGKYETGSWSEDNAQLPSGYAPTYFGSAILPDGRLIINGGEYNTNCSAPVWTAKGAIYDPVADSWTSVSPPKRWNTIGDAPSVILPNGSYMLADCCTTEQAIASISGVTVKWTATGTGKGDNNNEEGLTILPDGDVLTVDANSYLGKFPNHYEIYDIASGSWSTPGETAQELVDPTSHEIGPAVLRPDGTVIQFGATGHNDLYDTSTGTWSAAPDFPKFKHVKFFCYDASGALLPDGNVIVQASPPNQAPSHFFEFSLNRKGMMALTQVNDPTSAPYAGSYEGSFLELPTGQVLWANAGFLGHKEVAIYTPKGSPKARWLPVISSVSTTLTVGSTGNAISGTNFNGFSQGATYGDDKQMATNYPLVRITNNSTDDVCFGRSHDFSTMGVWTVGTTNAEFDIPETCETGASTLQVIVNGLASAGVSVSLTT